MGLNLSTLQIAKELDLNKDDAQYMAEILRSGIVDKIFGHPKFTFDYNVN